MKTAPPIAEVLRIRAPSLEEFEAEIHAAQVPVVMTGVFAADAIDAIRTIDDAVRCLGGVRLAISQEYTHNDYESQRDGYDVPDRIMSLAAYVDHARREPMTRWMCTELATPPEVSALYREPRYARALREEGDDLASFFFVGNPGNHANFHFDGDLRGVLLHQVAGHKRAYLVPPDQSDKMMAAKNFSGWLFYNFSEEEKARFLAFTGGQTALLSPGDTLFIPTAFWHHIDYLDLAISFNVRLRRNGFLQFLGSGRVHVDDKLQRIATRLMRPTAEDRARFDRLTARVDEPRTPVERLAAMGRLYEELYAEMFPERAASPLVAPLAPPEPAVLWGRGLRRGTLYAQPRRANLDARESVPPLDREGTT